MSAISWTESIPSGTSLVGNAPTDFPRVWKAISSGMTLEHLWNASGGASDASTGELIQGASRTFQVSATQSMASNSQITGRLALITTDSRSSFVPYRLLTYDSNGTYLVGSVWLDEHADSPSTGYWVRQSGTISGITTGVTGSTVTFSIPFTTTPRVYFTQSSASWFVWLGAQNSTVFTSIHSDRAGAAGTLSIYWEALGPVSSASF